MRRLSLVVALFTVTFIAAAAWAQQPNAAPASPPQQNAEPANPFAMWNVQQMIDRATKQVVKRYSLTPEQEEFTRNLMATRVNSFLDKHEQEIRGIFAEAIKFQIAGSPPPPDKVKEWTAQITPMFDEAKVSIIDGNRDFREILSDDQKKIHDIDLKIMQQNFKDAEQRLGRWQQGQFDPTTDLGPTQPRPVGGGPAPKALAGTPARTTPANTTNPAAPAEPTPASQTTPSRVAPTAGNPERNLDLWEMYVRKFIDNYMLDAGQSSLAMTILGETKKRASEYLSSRKDEYQRLQTQLANAAGDQAAAGQIQKQIAELNKPVQDDLFNEMKTRLDQIPTEAQRKAFDEAHPKKVVTSAPASRPGAAASRPAAVASRPALRRSPATRPATLRPAPASQPAAPK